MSDWEVMMMVVVEADTVEAAVEQGRQDLAHWAARGMVNATNMGTGEAFSVDRDGVYPHVELPS